MYMDENDVRSPRDRVDGELLRRLLGENCGCGEDDGCGCGNARGGERMEQGRSGNVRSIESRRDTRNDGCGCGETRGMESRRDTRNDGCGCNRNTRGGERDMRRSPYDSDRGGMRARGERENCETDEDHHHHECGENGVEGRSLAIVYSPVQHWREMYDPQTALSRGTMFRELDLPFRGDGISARGGNCRGY